MPDALWPYLLFLMIGIAIGQVLTVLFPVGKDR